MQVRNDYNNCLTNLACSIRKYFGLDCKHSTLKYVDDLLASKKPDNVVVLLFDGMGSKLIEKNLEFNSFFRTFKYTDLTSVFPATTTAATTSIKTGLNPVEHGWLGWNTYLAPLDKTITLFTNKEKGQEEECPEYVEFKKDFEAKTIMQEINETENEAYGLFPFGENPYQDLDDMLKQVENLTKSPGKKYIYAYDDEPDHTMHDVGSDGKEAKELIKERNDKVEALCQNLKNTIVFIVADHGHINVENINLEDYPELMGMLERTPSLEPRAVSFKVKKEYLEKFVLKFNELFGQWFTLYNQEDIINSQLFGDGQANPYFKDAIGDYIAIAYDNKCLISKGNTPLVSQHAGYKDEEIYVPLIIVDKTL